MVKYLLLIVLAAAVAGSGLLVALATDSCGPAPQSMTGRTAGISPLDRTWTTGVQENEEGPQVLVSQVLASPGSFLAEGKGFEPSTGCPAPDFESGTQELMGR